MSEPQRGRGSRQGSGAAQRYEVRFQCVLQSVMTKLMEEKVSEGLGRACDACLQLYTPPGERFPWTV